MTTKKLNLVNIQGKLSRAEMKSIMAGNPGDDGGTCGPGCNLTCKVKVGTTDVDGECNARPSDGKCFCNAIIIG